MVPTICVITLDDSESMRSPSNWLSKDPASSTRRDRTYAASLPVTRHRSSIETPGDWKQRLAIPRPSRSRSHELIGQRFEQGSAAFFAALRGIGTVEKRTLLGVGEHRTRA